MISVTGNSQRGFSLIELVLVLGLIVLGSSVIIVNFIAFSDRGETSNPVDTLHAAVREARFQAAAERHITELSFDVDQGVLRIAPSGKVFDLGADFKKGKGAEIRFYKLPPTEGLSPPRGNNSNRIEATGVRFAPDRSSTPFLVEIELDRGSPTKITYDPFSSVTLDQED